MELIKDVAVIVPCFNETRAMIDEMRAKLERVREIMASRGVSVPHFFLDDGAPNLPDDYSILVRHKRNQGLAPTLLDGYSAVLDGLKKRPDLVIRLDCQEHNPMMIPEIVDHFQHSRVQALFLPVCYWLEGNSRPLMMETFRMISEFVPALSPINKEKILSVYNQEFPLGYQAFRSSALNRLMPELMLSRTVSSVKFNEAPTWGLDLLAILLAAKHFPGEIDFLFGGWARPWTVNRPMEKIIEQRKRAERMVAIAAELGCSARE